MKYTFEQCIEMASDLHSYKELFDNKRFLYTYAYKHGFLHEIAERLGWAKPRASKYTFDVCREIASKCKNRNEMFHKCAHGYTVAQKNGWLEGFSDEFNWIPYRIFTYEKCREIASKSTGRIDMRRNSMQAYEVSNKNKWLDGFAKEFHWKTKRELQDERITRFRETGHVRKGGGRYRTVEEVVEIAHKYSTYTEFVKKEPQLYLFMCRRKKLDLLDFLPKMHERVDGKLVDTVYVYEFPETGYAYVGRSIELDRRDGFHHSSPRDPVFKHAKDNNLPVPDVKVLVDGIDFVEGAKKECEMIELYRTNGWNMLNSAKGGSLGRIGSGKWTLKKLMEVAKQYEYWQDLERDYPGAFTKIRKKHIRHLFTWLKLKVTQWTNVTLEEAMKHAVGFPNSNQFELKNRRLAEICRKNGWLDIMFPNRKTRKTAA